jgi:hypothetical protein
MAIVKANYVRRGKQEKAGAKANIRYIQHRRGQGGTTITRQLFGSDGAMDRQEAYRMIDTAPKGSVFFRFKISPDPRREDARRDLDMRELTHKTMQALATRVRQPVFWVGALHDDHSPLRHVHALAVVPQRLYVKDFQHLIQVATKACIEQRRALDLSRVPKVWQHLTTRRFLSKPRLPKPVPRGRGAPRARTCTCPRCSTTVAHQVHDPLHKCLSCGLILHRRKQFSLQRKEAVWER